MRKHLNTKLRLAKIKVLLIRLKRDFNLTGRQIGEKIGIDERHISSVFTGKKSGGRPMFCALKLLVELEELKSKWRLVEEIQARQNQLAGLSAAARERVNAAVFEAEQEALR